VTEPFVTTPEKGLRTRTAQPGIHPLRVIMLSIHSSPLGELGTEDTGGMSVYVRELSRELGSAGHCVDIYTCAQSSPQETDTSLADNVRLIRLPLPGSRRLSKRNLFGHLPEVYKSLDAYMTAHQLSYDVIHSHYWLSACVGQGVRNRLQVPHLIMFHTTGMAKRVACGTDREPDHRLISERRLAHACERVLAASQREKDLLAKYYGVPEEKIGLTPCGVDLNLFRPLPKHDARRELGLHETSVVVLYVGRFAPVKGLDRLIAAAAHLRQRSGLTFVIIGGDGQGTRESSALSRLARRGSVEAMIKLPGRVAHDLLPLYYSAADVVVVSSYYESFSLVALESLACGTPVVATRVGAMDTLIEDGKTGLLVDRPAPRALAQAIDRAVTELSEGRMGEEEIRSSVLRYNWRAVAAAVVREYDAVLATPR